ncbi:MAG TPA: hypothetical protein VGF59_14490 [Bryobacteraceae bacterium]|jgi:hypothetical protein
MIDTVLNLLFRCPHRRLTRPVTPVSRAGVPQAETYVVCLDCGKQFSYDLKEMRVGKPIDQAHDGAVAPPNMPKARPSKLKYALLAALPVALIAGAVWKKKPNGDDTTKEKGGRG